MTEYELELHFSETAWALSLGFDSASEYHAASDEAFTESVREYGGDE